LVPRYPTPRLELEVVSHVFEIKFDQKIAVFKRDLDWKQLPLKKSYHSVSTVEAKNGIQGLDFF